MGRLLIGMFGNGMFSVRMLIEGTLSGGKFSNWDVKWWEF